MAWDSNLYAYWYPVCWSTELQTAPLARRMLDVPLVVFRSAGRACVFLDRCPHRNAPLSSGKIESDRLQCAYHGWQFDASGVCAKVPGLCDPRSDSALAHISTNPRSRHATTYACVEQDGIVWVYMEANTEPKSNPFKFEQDNSYSVVRERVQAAANLPLVLENALDVPHTGFLHGGLFRRAELKTELVVEIERRHDRVQAQYLGEPRPEGIAAKILAPRATEIEVEHFDRFILPSIAQVEYRLGDANHFLVNVVMAPISEHVTNLYADVRFRSRVPHWLIRLVLQPIALKIFRQDAEMLQLQSKTIAELGGADFCSTEVDVLGTHIRQLLQRGSRTQTESDDLIQHETRRMLV